MSTVAIPCKKEPTFTICARDCGMFPGVVLVGEGVAERVTTLGSPRGAPDAEVDVIEAVA